MLQFGCALLPLRSPCRWHGAIDGTEPDWTGLTTDPLIPGVNYIAFSVSNEAGEAVYVGFNPCGDPCDVVLPSPGIGLQWRRLVDTTRQGGKGGGGVPR